MLLFHGNYQAVECKAGTTVAILEAFSGKILSANEARAKESRAKS